MEYHDQIKAIKKANWLTRHRQQNDQHIVKAFIRIGVPVVNRISATIFE